MTDLRPTHQWRRPAFVASADMRATAEARGIGPRALEVLVARGHRSDADLVAYFDEPVAGLHDAWLLPDAERLADRVRRAVARGERVLVFGDFDADGLTGSTILALTLRRLGLDATVHVPDRMAEGHGLSRLAVERARAEGRSLIVTVDTGTTSIAEVALAAALGIDVLVTDHHHVPDVLPDAVAIVNPHRPGSRYPDPRLAGTGVAFKVAQLLLGELADGPAAALDLADLAVIGTVADMAPIVGENRAIARLGLARLSTSPRPGIAALMAEAGLAPDAVTLDAIGYTLAPRLNAGGRMGDPTTASALLLAESTAEAGPLAASLEAANRERRAVTTEVLDAAVAAASDASRSGEEPAIVVVGDWPVGIIGLVAGRLAERSGVPAIVVSRSVDPWRASARGSGGIDLAAAFDACAALLERHGGHPQAAGCELKTGAYDSFRAHILDLAAAAPAPSGPEYLLDLVVPALDVDYRLHRELAILDPLGPGDPRPLIGFSGLTVGRARLASGGHAQLTLRKGREVLDGIAFDRADLADIAPETVVDVVGHLASRSFGGYESLQIEVLDAAPTGSRLAAPAAVVAAG
ncbi:MAG: single-stranded-DNA-specific exonuclease RecJ [Candidatus Limnocylindrales bacterium]|jgi:single-stranded-DNA-specific exonuclease